MGDGRYYTESQFLYIVFISMQIILVIISMMFFIYKSNDKKKHMSLLYIFISVSSILFFRFEEAIVVSLNGALLMRRLQSLLFIILQLLMLNFLYKSFPQNILSHKKVLSRHMEIIFSVAFVFITLLLWRQSGGFIQSYTYQTVIYNLSYKILIIISLLSIVFSTIYLFVIDKQISKYPNKRYFIIILLLWALPLLIYSLGLIFDIKNINVMESFLYLSLLFSLNVSVNYLVPYKVTLSIFNNVKDLILDYVFIIDHEGRVVYKNKAVENIGIFKKIRTINVHDMSEMFKVPIELRESYGKQFIKLKEENEVYYFSFTVKKIMNHEQEVGNIITFVEITQLIQLLDDLKKQQLHTQMTNDELKVYSENVYNLEKEKEINMLLDEIARNQECSMRQLKSDIQGMMNNHNHMMIDYQDIMDEAKSNLNDVRTAVSAYMQYYGGTHNENNHSR
ncbi:MAG: hypothetical protein JEZ08_00780 [Clostridiales bacterium]|nr:hypothetical protein [Clostridiales bacterium]